MLREVLFWDAGNVLTGNASSPSPSNEVGLEAFGMSGLYLLRHCVALKGANVSPGAGNERQ